MLTIDLMAIVFIVIIEITVPFNGRTERTREREKDRERERKGRGGERDLEHAGDKSSMAITVGDRATFPDRGKLKVVGY